MNNEPKLLVENKYHTKDIKLNKIELIIIEESLLKYKTSLLASKLRTKNNRTKLCYQKQIEILDVIIEKLNN